MLRRVALVRTTLRNISKDGILHDIIILHILGNLFN
jgi:hypothetical protein